jgi:hypothetical protein
MLDLGARDATPAPAAAETGGDEGGGMFRRLRESLSKSRRALGEEISASLFEKLDDETWERLEEALILADAGAPILVSSCVGPEAARVCLDCGDDIVRRMRRQLLDKSGDDPAPLALGLAKRGKDRIVEIKKDRGRQLAHVEP